MFLKFILPGGGKLVGVWFKIRKTVNSYNLSICRTGLFDQSEIIAIDKIKDCSFQKKPNNITTRTVNLWFK